MAGQCCDITTDGGSRLLTSILFMDKIMLRWYIMLGKIEIGEVA